MTTDSDVSRAKQKTSETRHRLSEAESLVHRLKSELVHDEQEERRLEQALRREKDQKQLEDRRRREEEQRRNQRRAV